MLRLLHHPNHLAYLNVTEMRPAPARRGRAPPELSILSSAHLSAAERTRYAHCEFFAFLSESGHGRPKVAASVPIFSGSDQHHQGDCGHQHEDSANESALRRL